MLLPFRAADGFGTDKPGGTPCAHLRPDDLCGIHDRLAGSGWSGCAAYDCRGAGQQVTQVTYAGRSWREEDNLAEMAAVFSVMRVLHGLLARLETVPGDPGSVRSRVLAHTVGSPEDLLALDLDELGADVEAAVEAAVSGPGARPSGSGWGTAGAGPATG